MEDFSKKRIFLLIALIVVSLFLLGSSVFAWFAVSEINSIGGIEFAVGRDEENIQVEDVHGNLIGNVYLLSPGNHIILDLSLDTDCTNFGVSFEISTLSFTSLFNGREDLFDYSYKVQRALNNGASSAYFSFDLNQHLSDVDFGLTDVQITAQKMAFFQRFREENSIFSVLDVTIISINGDDTQTYQLQKATDSDVYYPAAPLSLSQGDELSVMIYYNNTTFVPTVTYLAGVDEGAEYFAPTSDTTYIMENYNCFSCYNIQVRFETT